MFDTIALAGNSTVAQVKVIRQIKNSPFRRDSVTPESVMIFRRVWLRVESGSDDPKNLHGSFNSLFGGLIRKLNYLNVTWISHVL